MVMARKSASRAGMGKLFSEGAALLCPNFERARMCIGLLMHHLFKLELIRYRFIEASNNIQIR